MNNACLRSGTQLLDQKEVMPDRIRTRVGEVLRDNPRFHRNDLVYCPTKASNSSRLEEHMSDKHNRNLLTNNYRFRQPRTER